MAKKRIIEQSYQSLRNLTEKVRWQTKDGKWHVGMQKPADFVRWEHVEFSMRAISSKGKPMDSERVICVGVDPKTHKRLIEYVESGEKRWVYDMFIKQIDNVIILMH